MKDPLREVRALIKSNKHHHATVPDVLHLRAKLAHTMTTRKRYLLRLAKRPFFKQLLFEPTRVTIKVKGEPRTYQLLSLGAQDVSINNPNYPNNSYQGNMAFLLDPFGRVRFFFAMNTHPDAWVEMRGIIRDKSFPNCLYSKERTISAREKDEFTQVRAFLTQHAPRVKFSRLVDASRVLSIQRFL